MFDTGRQSPFMATRGRYARLFQSVSRGIMGKDPKTGLFTDEQVNICYLSSRMHFLRQSKRILYILMPEAPYSRVVPVWLSL